MMRNRPPRHPSRPGVEAFESRCLLSTASTGGGAVVGPAAELEPILAESPPALVASSSAATTAQDAIIGASEARARFGVTGAGLTAAVIDTGVDYDHPAFGGGFGDGRVVLAGHDFGDGDADPRASQSAHGTAVAGIIASRDEQALGVAPGAEVAALRVFGDDGRGSFEAIADALQWVITNHERYKISVVNLSISDGKNYLTAPSLFAGPVVTRIIDLIDALEGLKIPVVTAAGNSYSGQQGMGFTAIVDNTISVTGSDGADAIAADAQRLGRAAGGKSATDLLAPGRQVVGPWVGTSFAPLDGTSFAAPLVTGSVLLLQELYLKRFGTLPSVDQLEGWLRDSAVPVRDAASGITIGRLDLPAAAERVPSPPAPKPTPTPPPVVVTPTPPPGGGGTTTPPSQGGQVDRPSVPVAEPPVGSGGSGSGGSGSTGGGSAPSEPPATPGGQGPSAGDPGSGSGPVAPPSGGSPEEPASEAPASEVPTQGEAPATPAPTEPEASPPPPSSPGPIASPPSPGAGEDQPPEGPASPEPSPVPPLGADLEPATPADAPSGDEPPTGPDAPVVPPVSPEVVDELFDDESAPVDLDDPSAEEAPAAPIGESEAGPGASPSPLDLLFGRGGSAPTLGVRAWSLGTPGTPALWSRAQFLRTSRATAAARLRARPEPTRAFPAASSRLISVLEARRSMR
ncbi:S8 family serine peptidase [Tautonia plasticadhaerens]|uniref:Subtilisin BL n=1 Tax=Tautonia plasticadhaerens TaxID=2527974 RepID=A0A518H6R3_9BACT|nr:S8 family serine peptidase [Tautonia plasticadhaerens]QDV36495.1 Subtilisin BL [Tautonia plasticadhaerens]